MDQRGNRRIITSQEYLGTPNNFMIYKEIWRVGVDNHRRWMDINVFLYSQRPVRNSFCIGILGARRLVFVNEVLSDGYLIDEPSG